MNIFSTMSTTTEKMNLKKNDLRDFSTCDDSFSSFDGMSTRFPVGNFFDDFLPPFAVLDESVFNIECLALSWPFK